MTYKKKEFKNEIQTLKIRDDKIELKLLELQGHMIIQNQRMLASSSRRKLIERLLFQPTKILISIK